MLGFLEVLLKELGASLYAGSSLHIEDGYPHKWDSFVSKYEDAFREDATPFVVAVEAGDGSISLVGSLQQLWDERWTITCRGYSSGIVRVVRIPKQVWDRVYPNLNAKKVYDLTADSVPA